MITEREKAKGLTSPKTVFIAAISSDIGRKLAELYLAEGFRIVGTYREEVHITPFKNRDKILLLKCDLNQEDDLAKVPTFMAENNIQWDHFISAVGLLSPIGKFTDLPVENWKASVTVNSLQQLELFHSIYPFKRKGTTSKVAFLVGGAINRPFANYSAYSLGKIMLVKFCELISNETPDLHCVAIGTGWVASKIHQQTLDAGQSAGDNLTATKEFVSSGEQGTKIEDIFSLINWCFDRPETAGRNFSVVHDEWRDGGDKLLSSLAHDEDMFRLRRHGNHHKNSETREAKPNS